LSAFLVGSAAAVCALIVGSASTASASTVLANTVSASTADPAGTTARATHPATVRPQLVRPFTGTGCHTYDYWSGAHVCITVVGSGLNVQSVSGETDGPDSDWGRLWDTAGVIDIYGHPSNHYLTVSWASGGGVWLANGDNFCFTDTTLNQTACLTIHN
jgi:hypothetical protein